ncbi:unnamed protein product [Leptosia nina]|uniref:Peptidase S1 domain-containing protein n=1 Tax=Leptosia nina TaxID=320188 RepID=A0AAV1JB04_9NEOP
MVCTYFVLFFFTALSKATVTELDRLQVINLNETAGSPDQRIIGGQPVNIEKYPYAVQILLNGGLTCGGSLLTGRHVLSSAHCFITQSGQLASASLFTVRVGSTVQGSGGRVVKVSRIVPHPRYNTPLRDNDIAVVFLSRRVTLSASVSAAFIPVQGQSVPDQASVTHVGWGQTNVNIIGGSQVLNEVDVQKVNLTICSQRYTQLSQITGLVYIVTQNMMCAGILDVGGKDACQGDSGGPLTYRGVVVGITSWGHSCAHPNFPGVSARVSSFTNWINSTITTEPETTEST